MFTLQTNAPLRASLRWLLKCARRRIVPLALRPRNVPLIVVASEPAVTAYAPLKRRPRILIDLNVARVTKPEPFVQRQRA